MATNRLFGRRTVLKTMGSAALSVGILSGTTTAEGNQLIVDKDDDETYNTVQKAVDNAGPGDTINVTAGTYDETIRIDKQITLIGDPGSDDEVGPGGDAPVIDGTDLEPDDVHPRVFDIFQADGVTIQGFEVKNFGKEWMAFWARQTSDAAVLDCEIEGTKDGIEAISPSDLEDGWEVRRNYINDADLGITLQNIKDSEIINNKIVGRGEPVEDRGVFGIAVWLEPQGGGDTENITIEDNNVEGHFGEGNPSIGVVVSKSNVNAENVSITANRVTKRDEYTPHPGVALEVWQEDSSMEVELDENSISKTAGSGISLEGDISANIVRNNILDNESGVTITGSDPYPNVSINNNNISENYVGVSAPRDDAIDATCNFWGHATGPNHEDNPRPNPKGDSIVGDVEFEPWSVREIRDGEGTCTGGKAGRGN